MQFSKGPDRIVLQKMKQLGTFEAKVKLVTLSVYGLSFSGRKRDE